MKKDWKHAYSTIRYNYFSKAYGHNGEYTNILSLHFIYLDLPSSYHLIHLACFISIPEKRYHPQNKLKLLWWTLQQMFNNNKQLVFSKRLIVFRLKQKELLLEKNLVSLKLASQSKKFSLVGSKKTWKTKICDHTLRNSET